MLDRKTMDFIRVEATKLIETRAPAELSSVEKANLIWQEMKRLVAERLQQRQETSRA